jgi:hypothetical protein
MDLQQIITEVVPGSVWLRTDGSKARVLAVTNLSLPADRQQKYVPVVVYVGPSGKVFSRPLRDFAGYFPTWIGFDREAEKAIEKLTVPLGAAAPVPEQPQPAAEPEEIDMSTDTPVPVVRPKPVVQVRDKSLATVASTGDYNDLVNRPAAPPVLLRSAFQIGSNAQMKTPMVTAAQLSNALRVYSQVPDEHLHLVVHKLSFELSPKLTIDMLKEVFQPDEWVNTVDRFRIGTPLSDETVSVDAYMGVYPEFSRNILYGTVYIGADMQPSAPLVEHTHEITQGPATGNDEIPAVAQEPDVSEVSVQNPSEVAENVEQPAQDQTTPSESVSSTGEEAAVASEAIPTESGEKPNDTPAVPAKKPRKKRIPKKKVVNESVTTDDDDLDVANLS